MKPNKIEVGNRLKQLRLRLNLSISQFGLKIGNIPKGTVNSWERGLALPPHDRLTRIAFLAETTPKWILWGDDWAQVNQGVGQVHEFDLSPHQFLLSTKVMRKTEIWENDMHFTAGDFLLLREYENAKYTGRENMLRILSLAKHKSKPSYVIMTIELVPKSFRFYLKLSYKEKVIFKEALIAIYQNPEPSNHLDKSLRKIIDTLLDGMDTDLSNSDYLWYKSFWDQIFD